MKEGWIISDINKSRKITIIGKYFGTLGGTISVPMSYADQRLNDYHYGFDVISWTDTKIEAKVYAMKGINMHLNNLKVQVLYPNEQPFPYFYLTIHKYIDATKTIKSDTKYNLGVPLILPYVNGILYNTPIWYLNGRRYDLVKKFLPTNTTNLQNVKIDELYQPQAGDIWTFPKGDMKIVEKVTSSQSFGTTYISVITSVHDSSPKHYTTNFPRNYAYDGYKRETYSNLISIYGGKRSIKQLAKLNLKIYR